MKPSKSPTFKPKPNASLPLSPKPKLKPNLSPSLTLKSNPKLNSKSSILQSIAQLQSKIRELQLIKQSHSNPNPKIRYIEVPIERIVENQIIQYIDRIVQKQQQIIEYEQVEKVVEIIKEVPKEVWVERVIVRPPLPAQVVVKEVPVVKEVVRYVEENFDERLYQEVEKERRHCQELEAQLETNLRTIHRLKEELTQLQG